MDPEFRAKRNAYRHSPSGRAAERRYATSSQGKTARRRSNRRWIQSSSGAISRRRAKLKEKYGLSLERWDEMLVNQVGRCDCCGLPFRNSPSEPALDHSHTTGLPRGLICVRCNSAAGVVEAPGLLARVQAYLQRYN